MLRVLIELLSGLALAYILAFLPNLVFGGDGKDLAGSYFQIYLGLIAGVIITGEWMRGNKIWTKRLRKAVLWSIFGLAAGIAVHIFVIYTWRDQMPFVVTAYVLPYAIPAILILIGYEVMPKLKQNKD